MALAVGDANSGAEFVFPTSEEVGHPSIDDRQSTGEAVTFMYVVDCAQGRRLRASGQPERLRLGVVICRP